MCDSPLKGLSVSLRDASLYPKVIGRRRVTLEEVHSQKYSAARSRVGEFMEVRILHSFVVPQPQIGKKECNFILADQTDYISAIAFCEVRSDDDDLPEICKMLKVNNSYRIHHFQVDIQSPGKVFLLRKQVKRINLSNFIQYIENIPSHQLEICRSFKKYIPFTFTKFGGVDKNLDGKLIDLVAFVKNIEFHIKSNGKYQRILQLSKTFPGPSNSPMKITATDKHLYLRVYERFVDVFLTKESCYVFSNVKVTYSPLYGLKLFTTVNSIIVEVPLNNLKNEFPEGYTDADFIAALNKYDTSNGSNTDESQGSDDNLSLNFSQLRRPYLDPKVHVELSLSPQSTTTSSQVHENRFIKVEPTPSLVPSINPVESRSSPNKRSLSQSSSTTSPSKKSCQTPSQPKTEVVVLNASQEEMTYTPEEFYDCEHGGYPYVVNVKLAKSYKDIKPGEAYSTRSEIRGIALIINNNDFNGESNERTGTLEDLKRLQRLLSEFRFQVLIKTDLPSWELRETIQNVKDEILKKGVNLIDSLFVVVLSHGEMGSVQMTDGIHVPLFDDIIHRFDEENFSEFAGKPKIFVIQTCQRSPTIESLKFTRNVLTPPENIGMKNIIVCQGACPGQYSFRNPRLGTYMIYVLVYVMMRNAHDTHFEKMMRLVQAKMNMIKCDLNKELTCSYLPFQFKKMYFNPGLFERND